MSGAAAMLDFVNYLQLKHQTSSSTGENLSRLYLFMRLFTFESLFISFLNNETFLLSFFLSLLFSTKRNELSR